MKTTRFLKVWTICLAGLLATSNIGCDRDEPPTATATATVIINDETPPTTEVTPQEPLPSTVTEIYWSEARIFSPKTSSICRANADGTNVERIVSGLKEATDIALDLAGLKIYWTDKEAGKIQRADLIGTNVEDILTGLREPEGSSLDVAGGKLYWGESRKIWRANLDGTNIQDIVAELDFTPGSIALDVAGGKLYWAGWSLDQIQRANLDGTNVQDIVAREHVVDIALDLTNSKLYGCVTAIIRNKGGNGERIPGKILRANLNGTNVENVVIPTKGHFVTDIALVLR